MKVEALKSIFRLYNAHNQVQQVLTLEYLEAFAKDSDFMFLQLKAMQLK